MREARADRPAGGTSRSASGATSRWIPTTRSTNVERTSTRFPGAHLTEECHYGAMDVRLAQPSDCDDAAILWERCGLTRPWNDARHDFHRALEGPASTVLVGVIDQEVVATAMVGYDGHRGWVYYLAVDPVHRRRRLGERMVNAAEDWLRDAGACKVQLLIRQSNSEALGFYERMGYERSDVHVLARWLSAGEPSLAAPPSAK